MKISKLQIIKFDKNEIVKIKIYMFNYIIERKNHQ